MFLRSSASMAADNPPPPRVPATYHHQVPGQPQLPGQPGMPQAAGLMAPGYAPGQPGGPVVNVGGQQMVQELQAMAAAQAASAAAAAAAPPAGPAGAASEVPGSTAAGMHGSVEPAGGARGPAVMVELLPAGSAGTVAAGMPTAVGGPAPNGTAAVPAAQPVPMSGALLAPHQAGIGAAVAPAAAAGGSSPLGMSLPAQAAAPAPVFSALASGQGTGQAHAAASTPHHPAEAEGVSTTYLQANELQNVLSRQCGTGARPMLQHAPMVADAARRGGVQVSPTPLRGFYFIVQFHAGMIRNSVSQVIAVLTPCHAFLCTFETASSVAAPSRHS